VKQPITKLALRPAIDKTIFLIFFFLIFVGGYFNAFGAAQDVVAKLYDRSSEALVIGRLIPDENGSKFWFLRSIKIKPGAGSADWIDETTRDYYHSDESPGLPLSDFITYTGQLGLQGNVFAAIDSLLRSAGLSGVERLDVLKGLAVAALAGVLAYFLVLMGRDLGLAAAVAGLLLIILSPWLTIFAKNLYWVPFTWFLPIVLTWRAFVWRHPTSRSELTTASAVISLALLVKCFCGFEYIPEIAGGAVTIALYGTIRHEKPPREFVISGVTIVAFLVGAVVLAVAAQIIALWFFFGSLQASLGDFIGRVASRTYGDAGAYTGLYAESLKSSVWKVLDIYWKSSPLLSVGPWFSANALQVVIALALPFVIVCIVLLAVKRTADNVRIVMATSLLVIGCFAASISWFVLAKGHSYIHRHLNFVLWHVPFLIVFGAATVGLMCRCYRQFR
jgi:hypothetical protein